MVAKIQPSNGKLDITVEGPEQDPALALLCMFEEVNRTEVWKPSMCPHCDRDIGTRAPRCDNQPQNVRRIDIANRGAFLGNGNGCYIENNFMVFSKSRRFKGNSYRSTFLQHDSEDSNSDEDSDSAPIIPTSLGIQGAPSVIKAPTKTAPKMTSVVYILKM